MADLALNATNSDNSSKGYMQGVVWVSDLIGYCFYQNDSQQELAYLKTTDGGDTWAGASIDVGDVNDGVGCSLWYDRWTPGDSGDLIHIVWMRGATSDDIRYCNLDTSDDSLSTAVTIESLTTVSQVASRPVPLSITKARGGNLYCAYNEGDMVGYGFAKSDDGGATWDTTVANPFTDSVDDEFWLKPDVLAADDQDILMAKWDISASDIIISKYDDSGDSWTHTTPATLDAISGLSSASVQEANRMSVVQRWSDGHLIIILQTIWDNASGDLQCYDVDPSGTPTATKKTDLATNQDDMGACDLHIEQGSDDLYVAHIGQDDGSENMDSAVNVWYKVSDDGGATWSADTQISANTADNFQCVWAGEMTPWGMTGRFLPMYYEEHNTGSAGQDSWLCDDANGIDLEGLTPGESSQVIVII